MVKDFLADREGGDNKKGEPAGSPLDWTDVISAYYRLKSSSL